MAVQNVVSKSNPETLNGISSIAVQRFTSSGTYTPTAGMKFCIVEGYGAGSGSATRYTSSTATTVAGSQAGAAGSSFISVYTAAEIGASRAVTVGAGGAAGSGGSGGGAGGNTQFGTSGALGIAYGGVAITVVDTLRTYGTSATLNINALRISASTNSAKAINGNWIQTTGNSGLVGVIGGISALTGVGGEGAAGIWGMGRPPQSNPVNSAFTMPTNVGAGGGGISTTTNASAGVAGSDGLIVIIEFL